MSRVVHCDPTTDVLVIMGLPNYSRLYGFPEDENAPLDEDEVDWRSSRFPRNAGLFARFRDVLSSFRRVAFLYNVREVVQIYDLEELVNSTDFQSLLFFLESLEHLYVWPGLYWPEAHDKNRVILEDARCVRVSARHGLTALPRIVEETNRLLEDYHRRFEIQGDHFVDSDTHWVPRPPHIESVGCYAAKSWLPIKSDHQKG